MHSVHMYNNYILIIFEFQPRHDECDQVAKENALLTAIKQRIRSKINDDRIDFTFYSFIALRSNQLTSPPTAQESM